MSLDFTDESALKLHLEGSVGMFRIHDTHSAGNRSIQVAYLETHIGFDLSVSANETMLKHLETFREAFEQKDLDFDQIMQRDIDDARVSKELIPYLLDDESMGAVKFFPPIVIIALPVKDADAQPSRYYPTVTSYDEDRVSGHDREGKDKKTTYRVIRSGAVGFEAFAFEYPMVNQRPKYHDFARLRLNTDKVKLVIIDGQHRAMALLALHRNMKDGWVHERRMPFKHYYAEWTKERIARYNLTELQLPAIVCTFPELDETYQGDLDVIQAARRLFITLNKEARKVSDSRNILLNDQDLISHFLRDTLSHVKKKDLDSATSLRIWNVELDQTKDRKKISSPIACTGVPHIYYAIEHMMFDDNDIDGIAPRSGRFDIRKSEGTTENLLDRLDGDEVLGADEANGLRRDYYKRDTADKLANAFFKCYGRFFRRDVRAVSALRVSQ